MQRTLIAVADASRARLFTYERSLDAGEIREDLTEQKDLVDPARRLRPVDLFSESRPGVSRMGGQQFGFDDHRDAHIAELDAAFARDVVRAIAEELAATHAQRVIMCASPRMLGALRDASEPLHGIAIDEVTRDLVKLTPSELRERLADLGLLPARTPRVQA